MFGERSGGGIHRTVQADSKERFPIPKAALQLFWEGQGTLESKVSTILGTFMGRGEWCNS